MTAQQSTIDTFRANFHYIDTLYTALYGSGRVFVASTGRNKLRAGSIAILEDGRIEVVNGLHMQNTVAAFDSFEQYAGYFNSNKESAGQPANTISNVWD